ncbi:acyl-CoA thioesterase domain-containing protein [Yinghuangia seranimata]|uniref:acyl-CoA thioesterase domain-containing protein n=1 Tax=Yinghuangia seranimata TaxID=408067 RepID=UPI00248D28B1|nr:acyl-CoA thioesterase domain-containing protein [Yinghuangia seranimata]MDI2129952.1 thioesterase family protein [Yinghuangia seranimata]MDI2131630.1 thioesterase family protein [Yinghuangia seranimata]
MDATGEHDTVAATPLGEVRLRGGSDGRLTAELAEFHCINGRGFGGWTASLAAAAAARSAGGKQLRSLHTVFSRAAVAGELSFDVETLANGRTASAFQVTVRQGGEAVLAASAWFADPELFGGPGAADPGAAGEAGLPLGPAAYPRLSWVEKVAECLGGFAEYAVDYAETYEEFEGAFRDGGDSVALWICPADPDVLRPDAPSTPGLAERLTDIMQLDAHLMDAALRGRPGDGMVSLDLAATWYAPARVPAATLLEARGRTQGLLASTWGTLTDATGVLRASGTSQCRVYPGAGSPGGSA